ncbi:hypothetical protein GF407_10365 [candidate division KSB1 bacterium]|nr:hypothetical protein [candidate division KSB1 bacterium]
MKQTLFFIIWCVGFCACSVDTGLKPLQSGFSGRIAFQNDWPEATDQVVVVAAKKFPPAEITDIVMGEPLPLFQDTVHYAIYSAPITFRAIGVIWKEKGQAWDVTNVIGYYFKGDDLFNPESVVIRNREQMIESVDIVADLSKAKRSVQSGISGKLVVKQPWPAQAESVIMIASESFPPKGLLDLQFSPPIAAGFNSIHYEFNLQPKTYRLIGTLLLGKDIPISLQSVAGVYLKQGDLFASPVTIASDTSWVDNIDIPLYFTQ